MKYWIYGVNSMGSTWYLQNPDAKSCTLWTGGPRENRTTFDTREAAEKKRAELDENFRFGSTRHFIMEAK